MRRCCGCALPALHAAAATLALLASAVIGAPPARTLVELQCASFGSGPSLDCTVQLRAADGTPLQGVKVTLGASMPSMPMAHAVAPVAATPTARPGEYRGVLQLEMSGVWAVQVDVNGPARDRAVRPLRVDECDGASGCAAMPATRTQRPSPQR